MHLPDTTVPKGPAHEIPRSKLPLIIFIFLGMTILFFDSLGGTGFASDVDDRLRHMQIRDLLADNQWRDLSLPMISMPDAYVSPWSRLVDAPYVLFAKIFAIFLPSSQALEWAELIVPPLLFLPFAGFIVKAAQSLAPESNSPLVWTLTTMVTLFSLTEFTPGRIDHHNMQLICMSAMAYGVVLPKKRGGIFIGVAALCSVIIGLETLPFIIAAVFGVTGLAVYGDLLMRQKLTRIGGVWLLGTPLLSFCIVGKTTFLSTHCDAMSAPWIAGLTGGGAVLVLSGLWQKIPYTGTKLTSVKIISLFVPTLILIAMCALAFPQCLEGPYSIIDPISRSHWLAGVPLEKSFFWLAQRPYAASFVGLSFFVLFLFLLTLLKTTLQLKTRPNGLIVLLGITILSILLTVYQTRFYKFPFAFIAISLPFGLCSFDKIWRQILKKNKPLLILLFCPFAGLLALFITTPKTPEHIDARYTMNYAPCSAGEVIEIDNFPPGRILAPLAFSMTIAEHSSRHQVAAVPFHRAAPGIHRVAQVFETSSSKIRADAAKPFDYLAICLPSAETDLLDAPLFQALVYGKAWPGLTPLTPKNGAGFRLYKIDYNDFR